MKKVSEQVYQQVWEQVSIQIFRQVENQTDHQVYRDVHGRVNTQTYDFHTGTMRQVRKEIKWETSTNKPDTHSYIKDEIAIVQSFFKLLFKKN